jgi:hypothetical protein
MKRSALAIAAALALAAGIIIVVEPGADDRTTTRTAPIGVAEGPSGVQAARQEDDLERRLIDAFDARQTGQGIAWQWTTGRGEECEIAVFLLSPQDVALYASGGENIVTDPEGEVGVKLTYYQGQDRSACATDAAIILDTL